MDRELKADGRQTMHYSPEVLRDIERELSQRKFMGSPLGPTLSSWQITNLHHGRAKWSLRSRWLCRILFVRHLCFPRCSYPELPLPEGRYLVTWATSNYRYADLVLPVIRELRSEQCIVLCAAPNLAREVPAGADAVWWKQTLHYESPTWRKAFRESWPDWRYRLRTLCRTHELPEGAFERLAFELLINSQYVAACRTFLRRIKPVAIVTEYDRDPKWSCLVLAARSLGIPTFTLVHGVSGDSMLGFVPFLADRVLCWGEHDRDRFLTGGEAPERLLIGGCPRLSRALSAARAESRVRLGLDIHKPAVMLATAPYQRDASLALAECFCLATQRWGTCSAFVRLHPSERLAAYDCLIHRYTHVRFTDNSDATLDEAIAASDLVVVHHSGVGSDALVKGRLTIVLDVGSVPLHHGRELIERAGCPCATNADELAAAIGRLLFDEEERRRHLNLADAFTTRFCAAFGQDSARRISTLIREELSTGEMARTGISSGRVSMQP